MIIGGPRMYRPLIKVTKLQLYRKKHVPRSLASEASEGLLRLVYRVLHQGFKGCPGE